MLRKLLNFTKKSEFFLELDEDDNIDVVDTAKAVATKIKDKTVEVAEEIKETVTESQTVEKVTSETKEVADKTQKKAAEAVSKVKDKSSEDRKKETSEQKSQKKEEQQESPKPVSIDTSYSDEPFWVKLMYKTNEQQEAEEKAEKTFATDYLITKPKPRRRPGGSLEKFKTMASQTKTKF